MRRFELSQSYSEDWIVRAMGLNITNWDEVSYRDYKYAYKDMMVLIMFIFRMPIILMKGLLASVKWDYMYRNVQRTDRTG